MNTWRDSSLAQQLRWRPYPQPTARRSVFYWLQKLLIPLEILPPEIPGESRDDNAAANSGDPGQSRPPARQRLDAYKLRGCDSSQWAVRAPGISRPVRTRPTLETSIHTN